MPPFESFDRVWLLTWTTYGTWLPGDERGFVSPKFEGDRTEARINAPGTDYDRGRPELQILSATKLKGSPVWLQKEHASVLQVQLEETAQVRGWIIVVGAVMTNHIHVIIGVKGDPDPAHVMRDFKSYGSRALNRRFARPESGTWWTEQGSKRKIAEAGHYERAIEYVLHQHHPLTLWRAGGVSPL